MKGEIQIDLNQKDDIVTLIIGDNGRGLPQDFDIQTSKTLGITLVSGLVKQLKGKLEINSQLGVEFKIIFVPNQT